MIRWIACMACFGTGKFRCSAGGPDCRKCNGSGWVRDRPKKRSAA